MATSRFDSMLTLLYRVLAGSFLVVGLLFFCFPDGTVETMNRLGAIFGLPEAPYLAHRFWLGLGVAYMAVVTALAWLIAPAPTERRLLMLPLALGKAVSSLTCLLFFIFEAPYFIYFANFVVDGSLVLLVWWTWRLTDPDRSVPKDGRQTGGASSGPNTMAMLRSICDAFLPSGGAFDQGAAELKLAEHVAGYFDDLGPLGPVALAAMVRWADWNSVLFHGRRRLHRLPLEDRIVVLDAMERSRFSLRRQCALMLKLVLALHAYRDPRVTQELGVDPGYLKAKLAAARQRREAGDKGPYPQPAAPHVQ